jgi:hypothetical protein
MVVLDTYHLALLGPLEEVVVAHLRLELPQLLMVMVVMAAMVAHQLSLALQLLMLVEVAVELIAAPQHQN